METRITLNLLTIMLLASSFHGDIDADTATEISKRTAANIIFSTHITRYQSAEENKVDHRSTSSSHGNIHKSELPLKNISFVSGLLKEGCSISVDNSTKRCSNSSHSQNYQNTSEIDIYDSSGELNRTPQGLSDSLNTKKFGVKLLTPDIGDKFAVNKRTNRQLINVNHKHDNNSTVTVNSESVSDKADRTYNQIVTKERASAHGISLSENKDDNITEVNRPYLESAGTKNNLSMAQDERVTSEGRYSTETQILPNFITLKFNEPTKKSIKADKARGIRDDSFQLQSHNFSETGKKLIRSESEVSNNGTEHDVVARNKNQGRTVKPKAEIDEHILLAVMVSHRESTKGFKPLGLSKERNQKKGSITSQNSSSLNSWQSHTHDVTNLRSHSGEREKLSTVTLTKDRDAMSIRELKPNVIKRGLLKNQSITPDSETGVPEKAHDDSYMKEGIIAMRSVEDKILGGNESINVITSSSVTEASTILSSEGTKQFHETTTPASLKLSTRDLRPDYVLRRKQNAVSAPQNTSEKPQSGHEVGSVLQPLETLQSTRDQPVATPHGFVGNNLNQPTHNSTSSVPIPSSTYYNFATLNPLTLITEKEDRTEDVQPDANSYGILKYKDDRTKKGTSIVDLKNHKHISGTPYTRVNSTGHMYNSLEYILTTETSAFVTDDNSNLTSVNSSDAVDKVLQEIPWPIKKEAVVEGDLVLGGLMMVHEREDTITCGPVMPQGGIQALEAMLYTLDRLNLAPEPLLPNISLGAHILDDCDKDTYGLEMAVDFIKVMGRPTKDASRMKKRRLV